MKPLTPALEQALEELAGGVADFPDTKRIGLALAVLDAYRALPAVTGPWECRYSRSASLWVVSKADGTTGHLGLSSEATAQRYATALNVAEMNG